MTFLEIEAFLSIVQYGSFSAAAEKLYVTQPALGRRIRALEEELGYSLFVRNKGVRHVELTRQGLVNTHMIFEAGKVHMTDYVTPYGNFLLGIRTERMEMEESEDRICITAEYKIEIGEEPISSNKIQIIIRPRP